MLDYSEEAKKVGLSLEELNELIGDKKCPHYPDSKLFILKGRGGKLQIRSVSQKYQIETMQAARKAKKATAAQV